MHTNMSLVIRNIHIKGLLSYYTDRNSKLKSSELSEKSYISNQVITLLCLITREGDSNYNIFLNFLSPLAFYANLPKL